MSKVESQALFPAPQHNHGRCLVSAVAKAERAFIDKGMKLTPMRRRVLEEIAASHQAVGAYDILDRLAKKGDRLAPISVYRAIDSLLAAGVVHRLESRNAFFACHTTHHDAQRAVIMVCETCGLVAEVDGDRIFAALADAAAAAHFRPHRQVVELTGQCRRCQPEETASALGQGSAA